MMTERYQQEGGALRVQASALQLSGLDTAPGGAETLHDAVVHTALALCRRRDIPYEMEAPLSILLAQVYESGVGRSVSNVKRGDTSITYAAAGLEQWKSLLAPFVRLETV